MAPYSYLSLLLLSLIAFATSKIIFVGEVCRHGARSSGTNIEDPKYFPNGPGELTASGMRQHYLIGTEIRNKYILKNKLLDPYDSEELYVQSTQVPRTIQSAEAQLLGIYPLDTSQKLLKKQIHDAEPHINIYNKDKIVKSLGLYPIKDGYHPVPIHNYALDIQDNVLGYADCPRMDKDVHERVENATFWKPFDDYYRPLIYKQLGEAFNFPPENIDFMTGYLFSDILTAENFQGVPARYNFTASEWDILHSMQITLLTHSISPKTSKVFASRYLVQFLEKIKQMAGKSFNETTVEPYIDSKMMIFSSHDLQLQQILLTLNATNLNYTQVPYASTLFIELHKSTDYKL